MEDLEEDYLRCLKQVINQVHYSGQEHQLAYLVDKLNHYQQVAYLEDSHNLHRVDYLECLNKVGSMHLIFIRIKVYQ